MDADFHANGLLVVVHPGSLCGSADFNLGEDEAATVRRAIVDLLDAHEGHVLVVDGELSDELPDYPELDDAIDECLRRAARGGLVSMRVEGLDMVNDPDDHFQTTLPPTLEIVAERIRTIPAVVATGAWHHPGETTGCVTTVARLLGDVTGLGPVTIHRAAEMPSPMGETSPAPSV